MIGSFFQLVSFFSTLKLWIVNKLITLSERLDVIERSNKGRINKKSLSTRFFYWHNILKKICRLSLHLSYLIISTITVVSLFLLHSVSDILAQFPELNIKDKNMLSLNVTDAVYNDYTSGFLGSKNISSTPYRITEQHYLDQGLLNNAVNVTNYQTFLNTYLSDDLLLGRGNGTIETTDGQNISWISSDIGRLIDNQWVFYGLMLFNNTHSESLSLLNNSIGLSKSMAGSEPDYIWLLE